MIGPDLLRKRRPLPPVDQELESLRSNRDLWKSLAILREKRILLLEEELRAERRNRAHGNW